MSEGSDSVVVEVTNDGPVMFLLSRTYHPYWQVEVDGQPGEVIRTDYTLMGVPIAAAGTHRLIFRYRSPVLERAELISGSTWIFVLLVSVWSLIQTLRRRKSVA